MDILSFILGLKKGKSSVKLQEKTVTPSDSEIVVVPDTSYDALSKVIVEAVQSGGGSDILYTSGTITAGSGTSVTVPHGHGKVPDIIAVYMAGTLPTSGNYLVCALQISTSYAEKIGLVDSTSLSPAFCFTISGGKPMPLSITYPDGCINRTTMSYIGTINSCNSTQFKVGGTYYNLYTSADYTWSAISGLT